MSVEEVTEKEFREYTIDTIKTLETLAMRERAKLDTIELMKNTGLIMRYYHEKDYDVYVYIGSFPKRARDPPDSGGVQL